MATFRLKNIPNNVTIRSIGGLFRPINGSRWAINLHFANTSAWSSLSLSHAPLLARKRILNSSQKPSPTGWEENVQITSTADWDVVTIGECPIEGYTDKRDANQFCFTFLAADKRVFLPQFELARALFFHDTYLSRTALQPSFLQTDFDIQLDRYNNLARINILPTADYPLKNINEPVSRNMLAWVLLDAEVRDSYESIGRHEKLNGTNERAYRKWKFQFTPPLLTKCNLHTWGHFDKNTQSLFVCEIDRISNLPGYLPDTIELFHPGLITGSTTGRKGGAQQRPEAHDDFEIDDDSTTNTDIQPVILHPQPIEIAFAKPFLTRRVGSKKGAAYLPPSSEGASSTDSRLVGLELGMAGSGLPGADWSTVHDDTDDSFLFESKFSCFFKMVNVLVSKYGCQKVSQTIRKLPQIPRCSKHILSSDGTNRCMAVVALQLKQNTFHLLEVDTSDGEVALSTQLLVLHSPDMWEYDLKKLEYRLLKASLTWPQKFLKKICVSNGCIGIKHPHTKAVNKGLLDPDSIAGWAERVFRVMLH